MRAGMTPTEWAAHMQALRHADTASILPHISAPTLVVLPGESLVSQPNSVRNVAALLPDARVVAMQGKYVARVLEDPPTVSAIAAFLDIPNTMPGRVGGESTAVILFTDIADSTALTEQLGDTVFRRRARDLDERLRELIQDCGGRSIDGKLLGDGVLAVFTSARGAIDAALRCRDAGAAADLALHLGLHAGDVIDEGGNVYGGAVNIAARVATAAAPSELLVSDTVRSLARTSAELDFADRGEHHLKGVADPQRLFAVLAR